MVTTDGRNPTRAPLFSRLTAGGRRNFADSLRAESVGGVLLLVAAAIAIVWANSPWHGAYEALREIHVGPEALHLNLSLHEWAADGLLAVFFFIVGLELKREIVTGELRKIHTALLPVVAAVGGVAVPAVIYFTVNTTSPDGAPGGWPVPTATDIAFAVAVLAIVGRGLPMALRAFLLTLAVVDDLIGIIFIAVLFASDISFIFLSASLLGALLFHVLVKRGVTAWVLVPLAVITWALMHASGIHATLAGVVLGMSVGALAGRGQKHSDAERLEHFWRPISAGVAVPFFALMSAGVRVDGPAVAAAVDNPVSIGIFFALVLGKPLGIVTATWLISRSEHVQLAPGLGWLDILGVGALGGIGFTVALLMSELAFGVGPQAEIAKATILVASVTAATIGAGILAARGRSRRRPVLSGGPGADGEQHDEMVAA
ncbi:MAG: Na+/H+ antiporter NhaA [Candidatus Nanopelagicales bacterium]